MKIQLFGLVLLPKSQKPCKTSKIGRNQILIETFLKFVANLLWLSTLAWNRVKNYWHVTRVLSHPSFETEWPGSQTCTVKFSCFVHQNLTRFWDFVHLNKLDLLNQRFSLRKSNRIDRSQKLLSKTQKEWKEVGDARFWPKTDFFAEFLVFLNGFRR